MAKTGGAGAGRCVFCPGWIGLMQPIAGLETGDASRARPVYVDAGGDTDKGEHCRLPANIERCLVLQSCQNLLVRGPSRSSRKEVDIPKRCGASPLEAATGREIPRQLGVLCGNWLVGSFANHKVALHVCPARSCRFSFDICTEQARRSPDRWVKGSPAGSQFRWWGTIWRAVAKRALQGPPIQQPFASF